jgi:hypothetical protein
MTQRWTLPLSAHVYRASLAQSAGVLLFAHCSQQHLQDAGSHCPGKGAVCGPALPAELVPQFTFMTPAGPCQKWRCAIKEQLKSSVISQAGLVNISPKPLVSFKPLSLEASLHRHR